MILPRSRQAPSKRRIPKSFDPAFEKLTVTPFRLCAAAVPVMKRQRRGHIVLVTSGAGRTNPVTASADRIVRSSYVVSREATNTLVRCMALELAPFGVQVNGRCTLPALQSDFLSVTARGRKIPNSMIISTPEHQWVASAVKTRSVL